MPSESELEARTAPATAVPQVADLVQAYSALLFRVAFSILRSPSEAEDVVQDVFLRVLQKESTLPELRDPRVWLVRIAWNLALDRRRRIRPDQMDSVFAHTLIAATIPADEVLANAAQVAAVLREIDRLPRKEREVLLLSALDELGNPEVARILGRSESATRALLFRARTRLRERLQKGVRP